MGFLCFAIGFAGGFFVSANTISDGDFHWIGCKLIIPVFDQNVNLE